MLNYKKLEILLVEKGVKKSELKEAIGASGTTIAKIGKNEPVDLKTLMRICDYLQCSFNDVVDYTPEPRQ